MRDRTQVVFGSTTVLLLLSLWLPARSLHAASFGSVLVWGAGTTHTSTWDSYYGYSGQEYGQAIPPAGLSGVSAIAAGQFHTAAVSNGTVFIWGDNSFHQTDYTPAAIGAVAVAAGQYHTVVLLTNGTTIQLGGFAYSQIPVGYSNVTAIAAGSGHSVALLTDGTVRVAGGTFAITNVPALPPISAIAAGGFHTLALSSRGNVRAWGDNSSGQTNVPVGLTGVIAIAAGYSFSVALKADGTVVVWGLVDNVPAGLSGVTAIAAGNSHAVALKSDGTVVAWGGNANGQTTVPIGLNGVTAIAAGAYHTVAITQTNYLAFGAMKLYAGATLQGPVGQRFRVDYTQVLGSVTNWLPLTNVTLPSPQFLVIDPDSAGQSNRFYRAVPLP